MQNKDTITVQFVNEIGEPLGKNLDVPLGTTPLQLESLINDLLTNEDPLPYSFFVNKDAEIVTNLEKTIDEQKCSREDVLTITYQPQAIFRVKAVTRCTASLSGHSEAILCVAFSPDGESLATGSGDTTVRFWDVHTTTPRFTCKGHTNWVLYVSWAPDGKTLASGGMDTNILLWNPETGKQHGQPLKGHRGHINAIAWEPYHKNPECNRLASASKDGTIKIWETRTGRFQISCTSHTMSVTCLRWGGEGLLYSGSQDRTIKVWDEKDGKLCRSLAGHGHWVNTLALNTDYALRLGPFDHHGKREQTKEESVAAAIKRYKDVLALSGGVEKMISGSDDFTLFMWEPATNKKPIARLTGHQALINVVAFSPDGRLVASASFDKNIKLWNGSTGKFICSFIGHVEAVYQVCWSPDSRLLLSGSRDSTLKCWDSKTKKLKQDLPGHADEVYWVDWSPDGERVASGSKDRMLNIWRH